ncbi:MAG: hypothetical protein FWD94_05215 [Treponema sp.]|nr:hypothetical protein [Treponema sp.]
MKKLFGKLVVVAVVLSVAGAGIGLGSLKLAESGLPSTEVVDNWPMNDDGTFGNGPVPPSGGGNIGESYSTYRG